MARNAWREFVVGEYRLARRAWEERRDEVCVGYETEECEFGRGPTFREFLIGLRECYSGFGVGVPEPSTANQVGVQ